MIQFYEMAFVTLPKMCHKLLYNETAAIFDIDYCLYSSNEMHNMERNLVKSYALKKCTEERWNKLTKEYTATKEIFVKEFGMSVAEFHEKYEDPEIEKYLSPDLKLNELLKSLNARKFCFTNGCKKRAQKILRHLKLEDTIEAVFCCSNQNDENLILKPKDSSFEFISKAIGINDPKNIYFFDDKASIINAARNKGWNAYLIQDNLFEVLNELVSQNHLSLLNSS